ncbi:MAG: hypothetical protein Q9169_003215 [Polycauliona sp. 2 TL-2023]
MFSREAPMSSRTVHQRYLLSIAKGEYEIPPLARLAVASSGPWKDPNQMPLIQLLACCPPTKIYRGVPDQHLSRSPLRSIVWTALAIKSSTSRPGIETSLESLDISKTTRTQPNARPVAESWEDEEDAASSPASSDEADKTATSRSVPDAPPPTPISPSARRANTEWGEFPSTYTPQSPGGRSGPSQVSASSHRPEKSTATAGRMIAGALGVKAPQKSEEARAYEKAVREKESKRIARERDERSMEEERRQQARRQVWED